MIGPVMEKTGSFNRSHYMTRSLEPLGQGLVGAGHVGTLHRERLHAIMAMWLKAVYHDSGVTRTPEETILEAYDTMTGAEKPAFARI